MFSTTPGDDSSSSESCSDCDSSLGDSPHKFLPLGTKLAKKIEQDASFVEFMDNFVREYLQQRGLDESLRCFERESRNEFDLAYFIGCIEQDQLYKADDYISQFLINSILQQHTDVKYCLSLLRQLQLTFHIALNNVGEYERIMKSITQMIEQLQIQEGDYHNRIKKIYNEKNQLTWCNYETSKKNILILLKKKFKDILPEEESIIISHAHPVSVKVEHEEEARRTKKAKPNEDDEIDSLSNESMHHSLYELECTPKIKNINDIYIGDNGWFNLCTDDVIYQMELSSCNIINKRVLDTKSLGLEKKNLANGKLLTRVLDAQLMIVDSRIPRLTALNLDGSSVVKSVIDLEYFVFTSIYSFCFSTNDKNLFFMSSDHGLVSSFKIVNSSASLQRQKQVDATVKKIQSVNYDSTTELLFLICDHQVSYIRITIDQGHVSFGRVRPLLFPNSESTPSKGWSTAHTISITPFSNKKALIKDRHAFFVFDCQRDEIVVCYKVSSQEKTMVSLSVFDNTVAFSDFDSTTQQSTIVITNESFQHSIHPIRVHGMIKQLKWLGEDKWLLHFTDDALKILQLNH
ncbi:hypothetical protein C9374_005762 [Naegleria lovaniensis]|uniref:LisH domain-containing protein n=1 Tax=Naegleria lovaniensis TaxID=51637 RepID=A0AA88GKP3_NAELO|nr:uncharacterized protein C9374_005762 [Naegleria lovaniensis]KAG2381970.1 hypothetical protein C9374_005762 [Naegleria lovaniensis]